MASRGWGAWLSMLLGLVLGFVLASRLVLPRASELKRVDPWRCPSPEGCRAGQSALQPGGTLGDARGEQHWPHISAAEGVPRDRNFLFVGRDICRPAPWPPTEWFKTIPGTVQFFSREGADTTIPIPILPLRGVDDS